LYPLVIDEAQRKHLRSHLQITEPINPLRIGPTLSLIDDKKGRLIHSFTKKVDGTVTNVV